MAIPDISAPIANHTAIASLVIKAPHHVRPILTGVLAGHSVESIAAEMGISGSTARQRLYDYRKRLARLVFENKIPLDDLPDGFSLTRFFRHRAAAATSQLGNNDDAA